MPASKNFRVQEKYEMTAVPRSSDILLGRGSNFSPHVGNSEYRKLIKEMARTNHAQECLGRDILARELIEHVNSVGGRFLRRCSVTTSSCTRSVCWETCPQRLVLVKVKQALRDTNRNESSGRRKMSSPARSDEAYTKPDVTTTRNEHVTDNCDRQSEDFFVNKKAHLSNENESIKEKASGFSQNATLRYRSLRMELGQGETGYEYTSNPFLGNANPWWYGRSVAPLNLLVFPKARGTAMPVLNRGDQQPAITEDSFITEPEMADILRKLREGVHRSLPLPRDKSSPTSLDSPNEIYSAGTRM